MGIIIGHIPLNSAHDIDSEGIHTTTPPPSPQNVMPSCHISVVLLCMGRGGDPNSFRPARDESQYWCRRDALVRCVTSFLFGPGSSPIHREMILLFDDDRAHAHLSLAEDVGDIIPTEQVILSLFKRAAQSLNQTVTGDGLSCRMVMDPEFSRQNQQRASNNELPSGLDSKRQVLEYLQKKCSIDFLRNHGLNSSATVILRKSNKKALMEVWRKWQTQQAKEVTTSTESSLLDQKITESLFHQIIHSFQKNRGDTNELAIVGTLHESCNEFPCFEPDSGGTDLRFRTMLFLGAVRDMTSHENRILDRVCQSLLVPRVGIRFATVSEFTSKILSVLAFHQSHPLILNCSLSRLLAASKEKPAREDIISRRPTCLHVIGHVPMPSSELLVDLARRDRTHWCIVRVVVCALWRSRLASSDNSADHVNTLTLIFEDGVTLYLKEAGFVAKLASQHQAAPSEYQILAAIRSLLDSEQPLSDGWSKRTLASSVVDKILSSSSQPVTSTISINPTQQGDVVSRSFFETSTSDQHNVTPCDAVIMVLDLYKNLRDRENKTSKIHRAILTAAMKRNLFTTTASIVECGVDFEASCITCLQHFLYQNRLFLGQATSLTGTKRKASG